MDRILQRDRVQQRVAVLNDDIMGRVVALALGITLLAVKIVVIYAHFIVEIA